MNNEIQIYQTQNWEIEFKWDLKNETIWWSLNQIAELFWVQNIKKIFLKV